MRFTLPFTAILLALSQTVSAQTGASTCSTSKIQQLTGAWNQDAAECRALNLRSQVQYNCICSTSYKQATTALWNCISGTKYEGNFGSIRAQQMCICDKGFAAFQSNTNNCPSPEAVTTTKKAASAATRTPAAESTTKAAGIVATPTANATNASASPTASSNATVNLSGTSGAVGSKGMAGWVGVAAVVIGAVVVA
ncbi:hypothetical protein HDV00_001743 [Rhizophlyctis rosea]|nr:hypothetical protein HDV00_001743 [Rhizophlyctis rosea]